MGAATNLDAVRDVARKWLEEGEMGIVDSDSGADLPAVFTPKQAGALRREALVLGPGDDVFALRAARLGCGEQWLRQHRGKILAMAHRVLRGNTHDVHQLGVGERRNDKVKRPGFDRVQVETRYRRWPTLR